MQHNQASFDKKVVSFKYFDKKFYYRIVNETDFFQRTHYQHPRYQKMRESLKYWWPQNRGDGTQLQIEC